MEHFTLATLIPAITTLAGVGVNLFHARYGRKVRVKVGDIEVEAPTTKQVKELLSVARDAQQPNQTRLIS